MICFLIMATITLTAVTVDKMIAHITSIENAGDKGEGGGEGEGGSGEGAGGSGEGAGGGGLGADGTPDFNFANGAPVAPPPAGAKPEPTSKYNFL